MSEPTQALIAAYKLDGHGGGTALDWDNMSAAADQTLPLTQPLEKPHEQRQTPATQAG